MKKVHILYLTAGIFFLTSCGADPYEVIRETKINTPASVVYAQVINHKNRMNWSPWEKKDPNMTKKYEGPESGVGAIQKWSGNDSVGTGVLEIMEVKENEYIKNKLVFTEPWESEDTIEWWFTEKDGVTAVKWSSKGELPKIASMFMDQTMDEMIGPDFEKGLADLKTYCEANYTAPEMDMPSDSTMVELETQDAAAGM